jgi:hypothetical protein
VKAGLIGCEAVKAAEAFGKCRKSKQQPIEERASDTLS